MYPINRNAVIIKPKQPFLLWAKSLPGEVVSISLDDLRKDCIVILIPEVTNDEEATAFIEDMYKEIFEMELGSWYGDETMWPKNRSLEMFRDWFDIEIHSEIFDALDEEIEKEY
jgi:hypothetical protein